MAPFKALLKTVGDAKKKGLVPMVDFFGPKVKRGRPQKAASKAGRLATKEVPPTTALPQAVLKPAPVINEKLTRRNWSKGDGLKIMTDAVEAWYEELKKPEADQISMTFFAEQRGIPFSALQEHVTLPTPSASSWAPVSGGSPSSARIPRLASPTCSSATTVRTKARA